MSLRIVKLAIGTELDVVGARQRAREIAVLCGFGAQDQVRIATSVSELARNLYNYAHGGGVAFSIESEAGRQSLQVSVTDKGPGIADLALVLSGRYKSSTGMGLGILGARRLMDRCDISSTPQGTSIVMQMDFARDAPRLSAQQVGELCKRLQAIVPDSMLGEVQQQNQDLLRTLERLRERERELEESNRGIRALYAELDDKAQHLRHADEMKSRFLSNMSHEFRTPLSSIRALAKLLLSRCDGELSEEQEKQVSFILQGTVELSDMVDDLLDLAKIEAGKVNVRPERFAVAEMFVALRGVLRPLLVNPALTLTFHMPPDDVVLFCDQGKLVQILRNFISNAIKFTEQGTIDVGAVSDSAAGTICLSVSDSGIGIAASDLVLVFEEFTQIEHHLQAAIKGTGLGLPLCRKLAALMQGSVHASSTLGAGSVFGVTLPLLYQQ